MRNPSPKRQAGAERIELSPEMVAAGERIFEAWLDDWNAVRISETGATGDVQSLLAELWASWKNLA